MSISRVRIAAAPGAGNRRRSEQNTLAMAIPGKADPRLGVFETMLVREGRPVALAAHLARLEASLAALYGAPLGDDAGARVEAAAAGLALGRVRLEAVPGPAGVDLAAAARPLEPGGGAGPALRSRPLPGGLGAHKWIDRSLLPADPAGATTLLLDDGEEVLEAARANVFAVRGGALVTAAADGRILPGTARAAVLARARAAGLAVAERRLDRAELLGADEVLLTGSLRGVERARSLDGEPLGRTGGVGRELAAALRREWRAELPGGLSRAPAAAAARPRADAP